MKMMTIEIRAAEGGTDSKLLVDLLAEVYLRRAQASG